MDFSFSEEQIMLRDLARGILEKEVDPERLKEIETAGEGFDGKLWTTLAESSLLGTAVPETLGGAGFGLLEICVLLQEIGRAVAPVPVLESLVLAGLPLDEFGTDEQKKEWLTPLALGEAVLTAALDDAHSSDPRRPGTTARRDGDGWVLDGHKRLVPALHLARRVLVPASGDGAPLVFLVDPQGNGVEIVQRRLSSREPSCELFLRGARVDGSQILGAGAHDGGGILDWVGERAQAASCALQLGVCERALEITSGYVSERHQFGLPLGSFQAVQHRAADCYTDLEAMRWLTWRAAWRLARGLPASREIRVARFWAAEGGARIASAAQHLHGGMGVDLDYPVHRYFLRARQLELGFGAATPQLAALGQDMARTGPLEDA